MIDFIKNLFSGILSFFTGVLGGKKSQENQPSIKAAEKPAAATSKSGLLGEKKSQSNQPSTKAAEKPAAATAKPRKKTKGYFMELDEADDEKQPVDAKQAKGAAAKTPEPVAAAKSAKAEPAKTPETAAAAQAAKVELVQTAEGLKAEPAKSAKSPAVSANGQNQTETTFAPKYLAPSASSNGRRRPGPSMNPFLDMARQVKTPG